MKRRPSAKEKISSLYCEWDDLDPITRAERLLELTKLGCSVRGLANDLAVSPTNLRFHLELNELKPSEKAVVKAGASPKHALLALQQRLETQARIERIRQERATGAASNRLAGNIALFLTKERSWTQPDGKAHTFTILESDIERFFDDLRLAFDLRVYLSPPIAPTILKGKDFWTTYTALRPDQKHFEVWMAWLVEWLVRVLLSVEPEVSVRESASKKAPALVAAMLRGPKINTFLAS
jgi:hypothetical protein